MIHDFMKGFAVPEASRIPDELDRTMATVSCFDSALPGRSEQMRRAIEMAVSLVFGVDAFSLEQESRGVARVALARQVAMYLAHVGCGLSMTAAGRLFGRDRTTVAHACLIVEDRRDDPMFDRALDLLEWAVPVMVLRPDPFLPTIASP